MTDANASREMTPTARFLAAGAAVLALAAGGALWLRFGDGVYARMLVDAFIACF